MPTDFLTNLFDSILQNIHMFAFGSERIIDLIYFIGCVCSNWFSVFICVGLKNLNKCSWIIHRFVQQDRKSNTNSCSKSHRSFVHIKDMSIFIGYIVLFFMLSCSVTSEPYAIISGKLIAYWNISFATEYVSDSSIKFTRALWNCDFQTLIRSAIFDVRLNCTKVLESHVFFLSKWFQKIIFVFPINGSWFISQEETYDGKWFWTPLQSCLIASNVWNDV